LVEGPIPSSTPSLPSSLLPPSPASSLLAVAIDRRRRGRGRGSPPRRRGSGSAHVDVSLLFYRSLFPLTCLPYSLFASIAPHTLSFERTRCQRHNEHPTTPRLRMARVRRNQLKLKSFTPSVLFDLIFCATTRHSRVIRVKIPASKWFSKHVSVFLHWLALASRSRRAVPSVALAFESNWLRSGCGRGRRRESSAWRHCKHVEPVSCDMVRRTPIPPSHPTFKPRQFRTSRICIRMQPLFDYLESLNLLETK